jgi:hypothetical protein
MAEAVRPQSLRRYNPDQVQRVWVIEHPSQPVFWHPVESWTLDKLLRGGAQA